MGEVYFKKTNVFGIISLCISIVSLMTVCCYGVGGLLAIPSLILAILGLTVKDAGKGTALAGLIISIITIVILGFIVLGALGVLSFGSRLNSFYF